MVILDKYFDRQFKTLIVAKIAVFFKRIYDWHINTRNGVKISSMVYNIYRWVENPDRYVIHGKVTPNHKIYIDPETGQADYEFLFEKLANDQDMYIVQYDESNWTDGQREAGMDGVFGEIRNRYQ